MRYNVGRLRVRREKMIQFDTTKEEAELIDKIVDRAVAIEASIDRLSLNMDLSATHANGCNLDFDKLIAFDDFNFVHDVGGIMDHLDRTTGQLKDCFLPRCAKV
jgi:hypothetical protein